MKTLPYIVLIALFGLLAWSCDSENEATVLGTELEPTESLLTEQEIQDLSFLREEEKLARDVYLYAFNQHGLNVFKNIANSEQQHMDRVLAILSSYGVDDPALATSGEFNDAELQELYDQLTAKVSVSLVDALEVGAIIEDLDIKDLSIMAENSEKEDLALLYSNLACGSANHMRSFYSQLLANGADYEPQYISQEELDEILASSSGGCGQ